MKSSATLSSEAEAVSLKFVGPYQGVMQKVAYACAEHGIIQQTPNKVQQGIGCQKCGRLRQFASRRLDMDQIRADAVAVGLEYVSGYSSVARNAEYRCPKHGMIRMHPTSVRRGSRCQKCFQSDQRLTLIKSDDIQAERASKVGLTFHSRVEGAMGMAQFVCSVHGYITMRLSVVNRGSGCRLCSSRAPKSISELQNEAQAVGLTYADEFVSANKPARYVCQQHGEIKMAPAVVRRGCGCRFCSGNVEKSESALHAEAANVSVRYVGPYKGDRTPTAYQCEKHGEFQKRPGDVKSGQGCPKCVKFGYDWIGPAVFYVYRIERVTEPSFLGYGMTKDHKTRNRAHAANLRKHGLVGEVVATFDCRSGRDAYALEMHVWKSLSDIHVRTEIPGFKEEAIAGGQEPRLLETISQWLSAA